MKIHDTRNSRTRRLFCIDCSGGSGKAGLFGFYRYSSEDIGAALSIFRKHCPITLDIFSELEMTIFTVKVTDTSDELYN